MPSDVLKPIRAAKYARLTCSLNACMLRLHGCTSTLLKLGAGMQITTGPEEDWPTDEHGNTVRPLPDGSSAQLDGDLLVLAVGNGRQAGGGVELCPDAGQCPQSSGQEQITACQFLHRWLSCCSMLVQVAYAAVSVPCHNMVTRCADDADFADGMLDVSYVFKPPEGMKAGKILGLLMDPVCL